MTFVTTPKDVRSGVFWIHGKLVPTVSGTKGIGVACCERPSRARPKVQCSWRLRLSHLQQTVGSSDGAFVAGMVVLV